MGIGGGGDVVGALAVAELSRALGTPASLGGTSWERRVIDPLPGPRRLDEITGARRLTEGAALAGADTAGPGGVRFAESRMAELLDEPVLLLDPGVGVAALAEGLEAGAAETGADLVLLVDVGGDVLAHGDEAGLASPLCDSLLLAAGVALSERLTTLAVVYGAGCDGELTPEEVGERLAEVARAGGALGAWGLTPEAIARLEEAVAVVPTEASAQAVACARGELGPVPIRGGRRTVRRTPLGGLCFFLEPRAAVSSAARLAHAVTDAGSLAEAQEILAGMGVRTELDLEREAARA